MIDLSINSQLAKKILTGFIRNEIRRFGFNRAVIGLSGGIDSALSCYLSAAALGPENVLAVRMPPTLRSNDVSNRASASRDAVTEFRCKWPCTRGRVEPVEKKHADPWPEARH